MIAKLQETLKTLANAIRELTGKEEKLKINSMSTAIESLDIRNADLGCLIFSTGSLTADDLTGVTVIRKKAFAVNNFDSITIPSTVDTIGRDAFAGCALSYGCINARNIGYTAFMSCGEIDRLEIGSAVEVINPSSFRGCSVRELTVGENASIVLCGLDYYNDPLKVDTLVLTTTTPPKNVLSQYLKNINTIYVKEIALSEYKNTAPWSEFTDKLVSY